MRNIDRIHDLEAKNKDLKTSLDAVHECNTRNAVEAQRWQDIANKEHQRVEQERERYRKLEASVMQMEQVTSSLLAETAILCGEEDGDAHVLHLPRPNTSEMLRLWGVYTVPTADEYIIRAKPRKEQPND